MMKISKDETLLEPVYTTGHAASILGVSGATIRMYEDAGLILAFRTSTNRRLYSRKDIERFVGFKNLIKKHHINIESIKRFAALIPCWDITDCPLETRKHCSAFHDSIKPCWLLPGKMCGEGNELCRTCDVYLSCPQVISNLKKLVKIDLK